MNDEISSDVRSHRGLVLAQTKKNSIKPLVGKKYIVPSAAENGSSYVVDLGKPERCSCLDWSKLGGHDRPHRCKHIWAAIHVVKLADGTLQPIRVTMSGTPKLLQLARESLKAPTKRRSIEIAVQLDLGDLGAPLVCRRLAPELFAAQSARSSNGGSGGAKKHRVQASVT